MQTIVKCFLLIGVIFSATTVSSQLSNERIDELAQQEANRYAVVLSLNTNTTNQLTKIISKYDREVRNSIISPDSYARTLARAEKKRNAEILSLLGRRNHQNYLLFQEIDRSAAQVYYEEISLSIAKNPEVVDALTTYLISNIFPLISNFRAKLDDKFLPSDRREINRLRDLIFNGVAIEEDSLIFSDNLDRQFFLDLLRYAELYDEHYNAILSEMESFMKRWKYDISLILSSNYSASQIIALTQANQDLAKRGLLATMDRMSFFLFAPGDKQNFIKNIKLSTAIKESLMYAK